MSAHAARAPIHHGPIRRPIRAIARTLAMLALPAAIVPVLLLGPGLVHAPARLWRQASAEVQRLEKQLASGRRHREAVVIGPVGVSHERLTHITASWSAIAWAWRRTQLQSTARPAGDTRDSAAGVARRHAFGPFLAAPLSSLLLRLHGAARGARR